jgi:4a-hydroxytetrahydrobiopterin dehydratase
MNEQLIHQHLSTLDGWRLKQEQSAIQRDFSFKDFYQTMRFVNALADIAHAEDHHPELRIGYNYCQVSYTTHSEAGLSEKDFICARQVDALLNNI